MNTSEQSIVLQNMINLSNSLATAVNMRFMSPEHAGSIWKQFIKNSGFDVPKKLTPAPAES